MREWLAPVVLRMCLRCPLALYARLIRVEGALFIHYYCERCDTTPRRGGLRDD